MRIEMVLPSLARAGMETVTAALGRGLAARDHEVGFTCLEDIGDVGEELSTEGYRVSLVPAPGLRPNLIPRELAAWFSRLRPDVVHAHSGTWLKAAQGARSAHVRRIVLTLHGIAPTEPRFLRHYNRLAALRAHELVAVTGSLRDYLTQRIGVPQHKVRVIHNGIMTDRFRRLERSAALRDRLGIPGSATVIGNVARLHTVKNHQLLLEAFARVRAAGPDVFLLLVGDGPLRTSIEERSSALGIADRVRITGVVPDTVPYLNEMDVFVLSSHIEGLSISLLEAMACEVPVVATAVGGTVALLEDGALGVLVPPTDPDALAAAIARALGDVHATRDRVHRARRAVELRYSVASMVDAYEDVYRAGAEEAPRVRVPVGER